MNEVARYILFVPIVITIIWAIIITYPIIIYTVQKTTWWKLIQFKKEIRRFNAYKESLHKWSDFNFLPGEPQVQIGKIYQCQLFFGMVAHLKVIGFCIDEENNIIVVSIPADKQTKHWYKHNYKANRTPIKIEHTYDKFLLLVRVHREDRSRMIQLL